MPREAAMRFSDWQALVAVPRSTNRLPWPSMMKGCIGVSPVRGRPRQQTVGGGGGVGRGGGGLRLAGGEGVSEDAAVLLGVQRTVVESDAGAAGAARLRRLAEAL